jgi:hypothetical protein
MGYYRSHGQQADGNEPHKQFRHSFFSTVENMNQQKRFRRLLFTPTAEKLLGSQSYPGT